jgi:hypothetical protein
VAKYYGTDELCLNSSPKALKCGETNKQTKNAIAGRGILAVIMPSHLLSEYMFCIPLSKTDGPA